jgi:hypothetical protein
VPKSWLEQNGLHKWSVQLARFDEERDRWTLFPTKRIEETEERVVYTAVAPGFSLLAIVGSREVSWSPLEIADLSISPTLPVAGDAITVSARVRTTGPDAGVYPVSLWINDTVEQVVTVAVEPGQVVPVSFTVYRPEGSYRVRVGGLLSEMSIGPGGTGVQAAAPPVMQPLVSPTPDPFGASAFGAASRATPAADATPPTGASPERAATGGVGSPNTLIFIIVGVVVGLAAIAFAAQYIVARRAA